MNRKRTDQDTRVKEYVETNVTKLREQPQETTTKWKDAEAMEKIVSARSRWQQPGLAGCGCGSGSDRLEDADDW